MNAAEARAISNSNVSKLIEKKLGQAVIEINALIKNATKVGEFSINLRLTFPSVLKDEVIDKLVSHYKELDYEIGTRELSYSTLFTVSWEQE
ncbi:hypothetical protein [Heyndrickxia oleronia]|uniref:hypothetical protein n=1 Tax=Heyndrickxia oleronia TaxID=38875 RepID=UPI001BB35947|nr:hypothetical protein [Heyndrickxia oleronia]